MMKRLGIGLIVAAVALCGGWLGYRHHQRLEQQRLERKAEVALTLCINKKRRETVGGWDASRSLWESLCRLELAENR